eukprot:jgi/Ulvmu1/2425/UM134_0006.1
MPWWCTASQPVYGVVISVRGLRAACCTLRAVPLLPKPALYMTRAPCRIQWDAAGFCTAAPVLQEQTMAEQRRGTERWHSRRVDDLECEHHDVCATPTAQACL